MTIGEAILLGAVQGLFMFFPVSSTSHLVLFQHLLISRGSALPNPETPEMLLFDLVVHMGTLVSIAVVFRRQLAGFIRSFYRELISAGQSLPADDPALASELRGERERPKWLFVKLFVLGVFVSTGVSGALGLPLFRFAEQIFAQPLMISFTLVVTGILLYWTDVIPARTRGLTELSVFVALAIGVAQALSLLPGLSRSGLTIFAALIVGLKRPWAAQYSFFIAFPTIIAATGLQGFLALRGEQLGSITIQGQIVGFVVAAVVGVFALKLVVSLLYRARFRYFSYYVWVLAILVAVGVGNAWI